MSDHVGPGAQGAAVVDEGEGGGRNLSTKESEAPPWSELENTPRTSAPWEPRTTLDQPAPPAPQRRAQAGLVSEP